MRQNTVEKTYIEEWRQAVPRMLPQRLENTPKTIDINQKQFTAAPRFVFDCGSENWSVVAVTLVKNAAVDVLLLNWDSQLL